MLCLLFCYYFLDGIFIGFINKVCLEMLSGFKEAIRSSNLTAGTQSFIHDTHSPLVLYQCILSGQAKTLHIVCDTHPPGLSWTSPPPSSINLHRHLTVSVISSEIT